MKVLVTGSAGRIGRQIVAALRAAGREVRTLDRRAMPEPDHWPASVLDAMEVRRAVQGCEAVVHLAAIPNDRAGREEEVFRTNVLGTWNVLQAASEAGVGRVVFFSSIQAIGLTGTERKPEYLPLDDAHPRRSLRPYSLSKGVGEDTCRYFSDSSGITTICLRPTLVADAEMYPHWLPDSDASARYRRWGASDFWSYVDIADVVDATLLALEAEGIQHGRYLLAASDTYSLTPTTDLLAEYFPDVPLHLPEEALAADPYHGLIDTSAAEQALGWRPKRSWRDVVGNAGQPA
ncbi:MAG: NAD(P)-dependent oxidoreductase [Armatimonadetes bacterium]|nr:NAD(P)-dependent oxidoreductase [Armatimonadota bacterium]